MTEFRRFFYCLLTTDYCFYRSELVSISAKFLVINTFLVNWIHPDPSRGMNDPFLVEQDPNMNDLTFLVIEKSQIAWFCIIYKRYSIAGFYLLRRIPWQCNSKNLKHSDA